MTVPEEVIHGWLTELKANPADEHLRERIARARFQEGRLPEVLDMLSRGLVNVATHAPSQLPCLCKACVGQAPSLVLFKNLDFTLDFVVSRGRFLFFWLPGSLATDRPALRRSIAASLDARLGASRRARKAPRRLPRARG